VSAEAAHSHAVRTAARHITRTVLAHVAEPPDAAPAARHLVAGLAAQHGHGFIRHVADELATKLTEGSAPTATWGAPGWPRIDAT
jgi:hypothetical protein